MNLDPKMVVTGLCVVLSAVFGALILALVYVWQDKQADIKENMKDIKTSMRALDDKYNNLNSTMVRIETNTDQLKSDLGELKKDVKEILLSGVPAKPKQR